MPSQYRPSSRTISKRQAVIPIQPVQNHLELVEQAIVGVVRNTIAKQAKIGQDIAKAKAPVRRVFKGGRATPRTLSRLEMARITRRMIRAEPTLVPYKISNREIAHPNRKNTYARSWDLRELRSSGKEIRMSYDKTGRTFPIEVDTFHLLNKWQEEHRLNKEGRRALRSAKIVEIDEATWRDRGRGAIHIEVDENNVPTYHLGGNLRASIVVRDDTGSGGDISYSIIAGGERAPYARFMEFGTRYVAARPFLRPALKHVEVRLADRVERDLRARLGRG